MERSATCALQSAVLVTLLLGAQPTENQAILHRELSIDHHGRVLGMPDAPALVPGLEDDPGTIPNAKC